MTARRAYVLVAALFLVVALPGCQADTDALEGPIRASGFIEARSYTVASALGGRVIEVLVSRGDTVAAGDAVVRLDEAATRRARESAGAGVDLARASLRILEEQPRADALSAAEAALAQAEADRQAAQAALDLLVATYRPLDPPDAELHPAESAVRQAIAAVDLARAQLSQIEAGHPEGERLAAQAAVAEAEANLRLIGYQLEELTPVAPIEGIVREVLVRPGEVAAPGAPLAEIIDPNRLTLTVYVPQLQMARISSGDKVQVMVDAYPDSTFPGQVLLVASRAQFTPSEVQSREERVRLVFAVEIQVEDPEDRLTPGMPADVLFNSESTPPSGSN